MTVNVWHRTLNSERLTPDSEQWQWTSDTGLWTVNVWHRTLNSERLTSDTEQWQWTSDAGLLNSDSERRWDTIVVLLLFLPTARRAVFLSVVFSCRGWKKERKKKANKTSVLSTPNCWSICCFSQIYWNIISLNFWQDLKKERSYCLPFYIP